MDEVVSDTVAFCEENSVLSHVKIMRYFQQKMVVGRALEVLNVAQATEGETNYINVDWNNLILTSFEEIMFLTEYRKTLQVQFYGEVCTLTLRSFIFVVSFSVCLNYTSICYPTLGG